MIVGELNDILISYSYLLDNRTEKESIIPEALRQEGLPLAKWIGYENNNNGRKTALETKVNNKFNQRGWFKCIMIDGVYQRIIFGEPIDFQKWIELFKEGSIYFDSGMYDGNPRPYSVFRSDNIFWDSLVTDSYPKDK